MCAKIRAIRLPTGNRSVTLGKTRLKTNTMKTKTAKKKTASVEEYVLGYAAVDSGQLMICDPCYIDSQWENEDFADIRVHENKLTKKRLTFGKDFGNYMEIIPEYGKNMNELIDTGDWIDVERPPAAHGFSYNACAVATLSRNGYGQLKFRLGHDGAGVAFGTAYGDGYYPVIGTFKDGIITSVRVDFE